MQTVSRRSAIDPAHCARFWPDRKFSLFRGFFAPPHCRPAHAGPVSSIRGSRDGSCDFRRGRKWPGEKSSGNARLLLPRFFARAAPPARHYTGSRPQEQRTYSRTGVVGQVEGEEGEIRRLRGSPRAAVALRPSRQLSPSTMLLTPPPLNLVSLCRAVTPYSHSGTSRRRGTDRGFPEASMERLEMILGDN